MKIGFRNTDLYACILVSMILPLLVMSIVPAAAEDRFVNNGDGTITDLQSGLMWEKAVAPLKKNVDGAVQYTRECCLGDHRDWRLPTRDELFALGKVCQTPLMRVRYGEYLTASGGIEEGGGVFVVGIYPENKVTSDYQKTRDKRFMYYIWLVRDVKEETLKE